jgi:glycosyltransferase 2 family protein
MKRWQLWLGLLISLAFMYWTLVGLDLPKLWQVIKSANYWWLIPGVAVYFIGVWARAWRWHYLLLPVKPIPTRTLFPVTCIGYFGNNVFPARLGEVLRAFVLYEDKQVPVSASLATIIVERVFDGVVMLGFVFINLSELATLTVSSGFVGSIRTLALAGTGIFLGVLVLFLAAAMFPDRTERLISQINNRLIPERYRQKVLGISSRFLGGLAALRSPRAVLMIFLTSIVIWLLETAKYWFVMHAFPFEVSFFALMLMNGIVNLATTLPSAPGYIGTFDKPGIAVLSAYGVDAAVAAAYTFVLHAALWLPITLLGGYYMLRELWKWDKNLYQVVAEGQAEINR